MSEPHDGPDATWLIGQMYDYEVTLYGPAPGGQFPPLRWVEGRSAFLVARVGTQPVGCGAIIPFEADVAEVKRVYVESAWRRQGVARAILEELARRALAFGYRELRLETGILQQEAMALYAAAGFRRIACYGNHRDDPLSACYSKVLSAE